MNKTFCDFTKSEIDLYCKEIRLLVSSPKYMCNKCVRVSSQKDFLCKPKKIKY